MSDEPTPQVFAAAEAVPVAGELSYAPPARGGRTRRRIAVLVGGLVSSLVAIVGVYLLARYEYEDPFAWHALFVVPVGSALVAVVAAVGYTVATRLAHVRGGHAMELTAAVVGVGVYAAAVYVEYAPFHWVSRATGQPVSFVQFVRDRSEGWTWRFGDNTIRLGYAGYGYRLLDLAMFAGAGALAVSLTRGSDYCELCETYRSTRRVALFPASLPYRSLAGLSPQQMADFQAEQLEQARAAIEGAEHLMTLAVAGDVAGLQQVVDAVWPDRRAVARLPTRLELHVTSCPVCRATTLRTSLHVGKSVRMLDSPAVSGELAGLA